jgi:hypothetical protein
VITNRDSRASDLATTNFREARTYELLYNLVYATILSEVDVAE